jgi:hypothetical protein
MGGGVEMAPGQTLARPGDLQTPDQSAGRGQACGKEKEKENDSSPILTYIFIQANGFYYV